VSGAAVSPRPEKLQELADHMAAVVDECRALVDDLEPDRPLPPWRFAMQATVSARQAQAELDRLVGWYATGGRTAE
jgi:hypothetical protein